MGNKRTVAVAVANSVAINATTGGETSRGVIGPAGTHRSLTSIDARVSSGLSRHTSVWYRRALAIVLGLWALTAHAEEYNYHYVSLYDIPLPAGFDSFWPFTIDDKNRVYGNLFAKEKYWETYVAVYDKGVVTILQPGDLSGSGVASVNQRGTVGGAVHNSDPNSWQAALFSKKKVELIPKLPGAIIENVISLNDSNTALVWSADPSNRFRNIYRLYKNGKTTFQYQLPTGGDCNCWGANNQGIVAGAIYDPNLDAFRAIRFQPPYDKPRLLDPQPGDTDSFSAGINNSGNILGSSVNDPYGNPTISIGIWGWRGDFQTYSVDNTYYAARFNDKNLIVLSNNYEDYKSYLVPEPGLRLNLEDLVDNLDSIKHTLYNVTDINNRGDMIGFGLYDETTGTLPGFLLERIDHGRHGGH